MGLLFRMYLSNVHHIVRCALCLMSFGDYNDHILLLELEYLVSIYCPYSLVLFSPSLLSNQVLELLKSLSLRSEGITYSQTQPDISSCCSHSPLCLHCYHCHHHHHNHPHHHPGWGQRWCLGWGRGQAARLSLRRCLWWQISPQRRCPRPPKQTNELKGEPVVTRDNQWPPVTTVNP